MEGLAIHFDNEEIDDVVIMRIHDERVDSRISSHYKQEFLALRNEGICKVIVDLSEVNFVDSSGLGALLFGRRIFSEDGGDLRIVGAFEKVLSMFKIAKLDRVFEFFENRETALESFREDEEEEGLET
ncbi:STAS domain-containing protein [bacterium]|nr:STAS domain-containing protein [bacterium]